MKSSLGSYHVVRLATTRTVPGPFSRGHLASTGVPQRHRSMQTGWTQVVFGSLLLLTSAMAPVAGANPNLCEAARRDSPAQETHFSCPEWQWGSNGLALSATQWERAFLVADESSQTALRQEFSQDTRVTDCDDWQCGSNGPALSATQWERRRPAAGEREQTALRQESSQDTRITDCDDWMCGSNGPALNGLRAAMHGLLPVSETTIWVQPLPHPEMR